MKQDEELWAWIRSVNELAEKFPDPVMGNEDCFPNDGRNRIEMVSARFRFMQASYPHIVIEAPSMQLCEKRRDELLEILLYRGYQVSCS